VGLAIAALLLIAIGAHADSPSIQPSLLYDGAAFDDIAGGLRRGSTYLGVLRLQLAIQPAARTSAYVAAFNKHGGSPSDFAGDAQGVSSLAAPNQWRVAEAWVQQNFLQEQLSILVGRYDLNTEFYRLQSAGLFLNSSFGVGPEFSQGGPSIYPDTTSGIRVGYRPRQKLVLRAAAFNHLLLAEASYLGRPGREMLRNIRLRLGRLSGLPPYRGKTTVGVWHYTNAGHSSGGYVLADRILHQNGSRQLAAFGQIGVGDARADGFARYFGGGVVMTAPIRTRNQDEMGFGVAAARKHGGGETTFECTYLTPINAHFAVQPDLQYVVHPSADRNRKNALVAMLRFEISR